MLAFTTCVDLQHQYVCLPARPLGIMIRKKYYRLFVFVTLNYDYSVKFDTEDKKQK